MDVSTLIIGAVVGAAWAPPRAGCSCICLADSRTATIGAPDSDARLPSRGTESPRRGLLGNPASGVWSSRKLSFQHQGFSEAQRLGEHEKPTERSYDHFRVWGECTKEVTHEMKSGKRDRAEGALYKVGGRVLEVVGSLSGDRKKKVKGRLGRGMGPAKDGEGRLKGLFKK